jgi:hypothetical protein
MSTLALPRPAERVAILSMVLVFLCGAVLGAVVMSYVVHPGLHGVRPGQPGISMSVREWQNELGLSSEQTRQITSILDDFSRYYNDLSADGNTRIMQILNEEQKRKFEKMIAAHQKN